MPRWCFWLLGSLLALLFTLATIGSYAALQVARERSHRLPLPGDAAHSTT